MAETMTLRRWLLSQVLLHGTDVFIAMEAVDSTALAQPEWDWESERTWGEWEEWAASHDRLV